MVWFQCEDCGENLKKPKLPNHFRVCSAFRLSCIDCGVTFGQDSVQSHNQCITEAEKYGPKGQGKPLSGGSAPNSNNKNDSQKPDVDVNVGLSDRPPWFCSLCNTKATSQQTLLLHADGKKHRVKARAFHASQQPKQTEETAHDTSAQNGNKTQDKFPDNSHLEEQKAKGLPEADNTESKLEIQNGKSLSKKRKLEASGNDDALEVDRQKKIKWKKLIKSALKSNPDKALKIRKLKKLVLKSLQESGITEDEKNLSRMLEQMINSSSRFKVDDKYIRLAAKD